MYNDLTKLRFPGVTTHSISELPSFDVVSKEHCNIGGQVQLSLLGLLPGSMYYLATLTSNLSRTSILFSFGNLSDWLFSLMVLTDNSTYTLSLLLLPHLNTPRNPPATSFLPARN